MISSLHGTVLHTTPDQVIIDVGGVGFAVAVPADVAHTATVGEKLLLHSACCRTSPPTRSPRR